MYSAHDELTSMLLLKTFACLSSSPGNVVVHPAAKAGRNKAILNILDSYLEGKTPNDLNADDR
jgi:hypothetical protein